MSRYDPWIGHSMADNDYENPQVSDTQFASEPHHLGAPGPPKPAFKPRPSRSQEMNVPLYQEQNTKGPQDFLESVMSDPRPGAADEYRDKNGRIRFTLETQGRVWLILAETWDEVLQQLDYIEAQEVSSHGKG